MNTYEAEKRRLTCKLCMRKPGMGFCKRHSPKTKVTERVYIPIERHRELMKDLLLSIPVEEELPPPPNDIPFNWGTESSEDEWERKGRNQAKRELKQWVDEKMKSLEEE